LEDINEAAKCDGTDGKVRKFRAIGRVFAGGWA